MMIDITAIRTFASSYAGKLTEAAFNNHSFLTGKELISLSPVRQVNLFTIKILFTKWQDEIKHLESPYFDYSDPEVRKSLVEFMNLLSQKIKVDRVHLQPLLEEAVEETLLLALDPVQFLELELGAKKTIQSKYIKQTGRYFSIYKTEIIELLTAFENQPVGNLIDEAIIRFEDFPTSDVLDQLNKGLGVLHPFDFSEFLLQETSTEASDLFEINEEKVIDTLPIEKSDEDSEQYEEPVANVTPQEEKKNPFISAEEEEDERPTLRSSFEEERQTVADSHRTKKVATLTQAINVQQRYMFLQELFDGDNEAYNEALLLVEECGSFDEAVEKLVQRYSKDFFWDMNSDEVKELLKVVYRKFKE